MITTKQLIGATALGLALFGNSSAIAQSVDELESPGLIGKRYAGADFLIKDHRDVSDNGYGGTFVFNQPISDVVDLTGSYSYTQFDTQGVDLKQSTFEVGALYYAETDGYKPFLAASLGYGWDKWSIPGAQNDNDEGFLYSIGVGAEVPLADRTAAFGSISYRDGVDSDTEESWGAEAGVNHWITSRVAIKASVYVVEDDSVSFRIGARFAF